MKKIILIIFILCLIVFSCFYTYANMEKEIPKIDIEDEKVEISKYYVYSTYLNMEGSMDLTDISYEDVKLSIYNGEFRDIDINYDVSGTRLTFEFSEEVNRGLNLDDIKKGKYYLFIKVTFKNFEDDKKIIRYYALDNKTDYKETKYYTMSNVNNKVLINSDNDYPTMMLNVTDNKDKDVVDFAIDPGHGGMDGGAEAFGVCERDFTYKVAKEIGEGLKKAGFKVAYTRDDVDENTLIEEYNEHGRAVIPSEKHAKYVISVHFNSSDASVKGLEVYTPIGINYDLAKSFVENITKSSGLDISNKKTYKLDDGIYGHNFSKEDIERTLAGYEKKGYKPYNVTTNSNYYYMIRETGGIVTGAYVSDLNEKVGYNPYYNSNVGAEAYIIEFGYITNKDDVELIKTKHKEFAKGVIDTINANFKKE